MRTIKNTKKLHTKNDIQSAILLNEKKIAPNDYEKKSKLDNYVRKGIQNEFSIMLAKEHFSDEERKNVIEYIEDYIVKNKYFFTSKDDEKEFINSIVDDIFGLGVLETYLKDPTIQEIWVVGHDNVFYEKNGKRIKSSLKFRNDTAVVSLINKILAPINRKADESNPSVDARLANGSRVAVTLPPLSLKGPQITIRKFKEDAFGLKEYVKYNSASQEMADFLEISVQIGLNILVAGGTGSGKTTLLNALSKAIPVDRSLEHIITIEDSAELQMDQPFVSSWETKNSNSEGKGGIDASKLLKHALRNSPDRIILGEMRDAVAQDVIQAVNTGHDGTMSTIHAENPSKAIERFSSLAAQSTVITAEEAKKYIGSSFDLIVFVEKFFNTKTNKHERKITAITYVAGSGKEGASKLRLKTKNVDENRVYLEDLYIYDKDKGEFVIKGFIPRELMNKAKEKGYEYPLKLFINEKTDKKEV